MAQNYVPYKVAQTYAPNVAQTYLPNADQTYVYIYYILTQIKTEMT